MTGEHAPSEPEPACLNCQTSLVGRFCHQCGQEGRSSLYSLRQLLADVMHDVLDLEGKVVRSLGQLLFHPGRMTEEYIAGKRVRYVSPLRMYLLASVVWVAAQAAFGLQGFLEVPDEDTDEAKAKVTSTAEVLPGPNIAPGVRVSVRGSTVSKAAAERAWQWFPTAFMVLPPVLALVMMAVYGRRKLPYSAHLYLALHLQAFAYFLFGAELLLSWPLYWTFGAPPTVGSRVVKALVMLAVAGHIVLAIRRVYGLRWRSVVVRTPVVMFLYLIVTLAVVLATVQLAGLIVR